MSNNRTSQAVENCLRKIRDNPWPTPKETMQYVIGMQELQKIAEKYQRMEAALCSISRDCQGTSVPITRILNCLLTADEALAFDPLSNTIPL